MHLRNVIVALLALATIAFCQATAPSALDNNYQVRYVANVSTANTLKSEVNIINTGGNGNVPVNGPGFPNVNSGNICVNVYTLDTNEELLSCCSCQITPNQVVSIDVGTILQNTLTGFSSSSATIKLVGSYGDNTTGATTCAHEASQTITTTPGVHGVTGGFVAFGTTNHSTGGGAFQLTETAFIPAVLNSSELTSLTTRCASIIGNGSGSGVCAGCAKGALGATKK